MRSCCLLLPVIQAAQAQAQAAGIAIETHLIPGHPVHAIVAMTKQHQFDLLVVGFMGHTRLYEQLIGSTTERLVRLAPCAVLVVK
jgi:nucleotide-binding universal stress UspA family protein